MTEQMIATLRARWPAGAAVSGLETSFENAINMIGAPGLKRAELVKAGKLSPAGIAEEVRGHAAKNYLDALRRAAKNVEDGRADLNARRAKLAAPKIDRADMLAASHRAEARALLRTMNPAVRADVLLKEPLLRDAALELPDIFSGIDASFRQNLQRTLAETTHAAEIASLDEREEALTVVETALSMATFQLRENAGLDETRFNAWRDNPAAFEAAQREREAA